MAFHLHTRRGRRGEGGYVMLTLLLIMALIAIAAGAIVQSITFDIKRDREEEMIHRGVQYSRAIRNYYRKFGRYPTKLEDLESSNNLRFLRRRYKDPMNCPNAKCQDFKLLHFGEVKLSFTGGIGGGTIPGASPVGGTGGMNGGLSGSGGLGQSSAFGGNSAFGTNSNSAFGTNQQNNASAGPDASSASQTVTPGPPGTTDNSSPADKSLSSQVFGGGPIVGVVSDAKCPPRPKDECEGYREFNHKKKYNEWQFVFDPAMGAGLLMTPNQQSVQGLGQQGMQNGIGQNGNGQSTGTGFGTSSPGIQNNPNSPGGGFGTPNPPSNPPQQQ